jgi:hypothetical protein
LNPGNSSRAFLVLGKQMILLKKSVPGPIFLERLEAGVLRERSGGTLTNDGTNATGVLSDGIGAGEKLGDETNEKRPLCSLVWKGLHFANILPQYLFNSWF